jgi:hypothetical protein
LRLYNRFVIGSNGGMRRSVVICFAVLAAISPASAITAVPGPLMVSDAWAPAPAKAGDDTGLYMTIVNNGDVGDNLLRTRCSFAQFTENVTVDSGGEGSPSTRVVPAIPIPGRKTVTLTPSGYHVRVLQTTGKLTPGQVLGCTVRFQLNGERLVEVMIRPPGATTFN